ncbi:MAG: L-seryl-tRNA(Sec) selenium transferase [Candidatus Solibacter sp.]
MSQSQKLRDLPAVHEVLDELAPLLAQFPRSLVISEIRRAVEAARAGILAGDDGDSEIAARVRESLARLEKPSQRAVINATGVVLHTNLGRAPLGAVTLAGGYSNLEYDLATGRRGKRDTHTADLLERLIGAPGIVVNNNAAAVFLALHELAAGGEAIVSRGELIEIGDGFRIPDIMARSGAALREVGTTNRTHIDDYRNAITDRTRLLMRVHPSNFRVSGFTSKPDLRELAALGRERGIPVYEDLGSGCVVDLRDCGIEEPLVADSLAAGVDLVSFSGDKLLGGPQAGILAGRADLVTRLRRNPLFRVLRVDKVICSLLESTLRDLVLQRWDRVPAIAMLRMPAERIRERALALLPRITAAAEVIDGRSVTGGGATPEQSIATWLIAVRCASAAEAERKLRARSVIARIEEERLLLDLRTVFSWEEDAVVAALNDLAPDERR